MSWTLDKTINPHREYIALEDEEIAKAIKHNPEAEDTVREAWSAAARILIAGVVGSINSNYRVAMSGHANPGHTARDGYANDCVTISITQVTPPKPRNTPETE